MLDKTTFFSDPAYFVVARCFFFSLLREPTLVTVDISIVGNGILGLMTAYELTNRDPSLKVAVIGPANREGGACLLYTSPSPRDKRQSRMPSSA